MKTPLVLMVSFVFSTSVMGQKTLLTEKLIDDLTLGGMALNKLQVYPSHSFTIINTNLSASTEVISGKVKIEKGSNKDKIKVKRNTPGICRKRIADTLFVDFEGDEKKLLKFIFIPSYPKIAQLTGINAYKTKVDSPFNTLYKIEVYYGGQKCDLIHSRDVRLTIKKSIIRKKSVTRREAKGVLVE